MRTLIPPPAFAPGAIPGLQHVVVICDGTQRGDAAGRLAESLATSTGATVRAMTVLTFPDPSAPWQNDPVLATLEAANDQLYRVAREPGLWRLTLLTGRWPERLLTVCAEEQAELIILPGHACDGAEAIARAAGAVVACVEDAGDSQDGRVQLTTPPGERGEQLGRLVAAVAGGLGYAVATIERCDTHANVVTADTWRFSDRRARA
jgi:nucleotide-binding universal stress UspA family protein